MQCNDNVVKLRLIWKAESQEQAHPKQCCFNETLTEDSFTKGWKIRVEKKFNCASLALHYSPVQDAEACPLESDQDFPQLRHHYQRALKAHDKASTYRIVVWASPAMSVPCASMPSSGVQTRRQRVSSLQSSNTLISGVGIEPSDTRPASGKPARQPSVKNLRSSNSGAAATPVNKKLRVQQAEALASPVTDHEPAQLPATVEAEVCWDHILRSIVKTVDRHHFGSKLAAAASAAS